MSKISSDPATGRWLALEGLANIRDLGGLPTASGARTRPGVLLRSEDPIGCVPSDVEHLCNTIGLSLVSDLRTDDEHAANPACPLQGAGVTRLRAPLADQAGLDAAFASTVPADDASAVAWMAAAYLTVAEVGADQVVRILDRLVGRDGIPALVHCAAGKDRTGIVVALLLAAAGVERHAIVADYAQTGERLQAVRRAVGRRPGNPLREDAPPPVVMGAPAACLELFLDAFTARHGSVAEWLLEIGAPTWHLRRWTELLVDD